MLDKEEIIKNGKAALAVFKEASISLSKGTATYGEFVIITSILQYCEQKFISKPELGFGEEINNMRIMLSSLLSSVNSGAVTNLNNWKSPFMTLTNVKILAEFVYVLENQYTGKPCLDTKFSASDLLENCVIDYLTIYNFTTYY